MDEQIIRRMTAVKNSEVIMPCDKHFPPTIKATSPRVIIPTPIFKESDQLNLSAFAISPHPIIFASSATATKATQNRRSFGVTARNDVFRPIPVKKIGAKIIYVLILVLLLMYSASFKEQRMIPAV